MGVCRLSSLLLGQLTQIGFPTVMYGTSAESKINVWDLESERVWTILTLIATTDPKIVLSKPEIARAKVLSSKSITH